MSPDVLFRALSDPTRLRSLALLEAEGELCVCELTFALKLSQPKVSRHLAYLRDAGVVADRRAGVWVHYRLAPDLPAWAHAALHAAGTALAGDAAFRADRARLDRMPGRPLGHCRIEPPRRARTARVRI